MNEDSVRREVIEIIAERLGISREKVVQDASFVHDLGADSLDQVELVMAIEDHFDMDIPDSDFENIKTVQDLLKYVTDKV
jgi:acyl carrier protein